MLIARSLAELDSAVSELRREDGTLALVPTMGALHEGHLALIEAGRRRGGTVAASIFVNPTQFGVGEDLARYPRDEAGDLAKLEAAGCDLVWLPSVEVMYPPGDVTRIEVGGPSQGFEGTARPGHFAGVATVVAKLFGQTRADLALFGAKDWQQVQVIKRMVADLCLPVAIEVVPTLRAPDGLALSSRNRFLSEAERAVAPVLYQTLERLAGELRGGAEVRAAIGAASVRLRAVGFRPDYVALVDAESLQPIERLGGENRVLAAARLGGVRLLDSVGV